MTGILGNFFKPENMDRLALGFNQLRMRPDAGLATSIQNRQALRQQQMGRDAAMEFFQGKPGADAYIAALGAGGDGAGLIQSYITAQNAAARSNVGKVDRNSSIAFLRKKEAEGDTEAGRIADMIEAGGNAGQLLGIYYQGEVSGQKVQQSKFYPGGLEVKQYANGDSKYYLNGQELLNADDILKAQQTVQKFEAEGEGLTAEAKINAKQLTDQRAAIRGVRERIEATAPLIEELLSHPGMNGSVGSLIKAQREPNSFAENAPEREFITKYKQLEGKIFLAAFAGLRGGGQITEAEGRKASEAASNISRGLGPTQLKSAMRSYVRSLVNQHQRLLVELENMQSSNPPAPISEDILNLFPNL